jgi:hypothetical protein
MVSRRFEPPPSPSRRNIMKNMLFPIVLVFLTAFPGCVGKDEPRLETGNRAEDGREMKNNPEKSQSEPTEDKIKIDKDQYDELLAEMREISSTLRRIESKLGDGSTQVAVRRDEIPFESIRNVIRERASEHIAGMRKQIERITESVKSVKTREGFLKGSEQRLSRYEELLSQIENAPTKDELIRILKENDEFDWYKEAVDNWKYR